MEERHELHELGRGEWPRKNAEFNRRKRSFGTLQLPSVAGRLLCEGMFGGFYKGKRVLVTGHSGFKGGWLSLWLHELGASVWGVSLPAPTDPNLYEVIRPECFKG